MLYGAAPIQCGEHCRVRIPVPDRKHPQIAESLYAIRGIQPKRMPRRSRVQDPRPRVMHKQESRVQDEGDARARSRSRSPAPRGSRVKLVPGPGSEPEGDIVETDTMPAHGAWQCDECGSLVKKWLPVCTTRGCSGRRPSVHKFLPGDWYCQVCGNHNFKRRKSCGSLNCPTMKIKPGDWLCPKCGHHNFAKRATCWKCGDKRPEVNQYTAEESRGRRYHHSYPVYSYSTPTGNSAQPILWGSHTVQFRER